MADAVRDGCNYTWWSTQCVGFIQHSWIEQPITQHRWWRSHKLAMIGSEHLGQSRKHKRWRSQHLSFRLRSVDNHAKSHIIATSFAPWHETTNFVQTVPLTTAITSIILRAHTPNHDPGKQATLITQKMRDLEKNGSAMPAQNKKIMACREKFSHGMMKPDHAARAHYNVQVKSCICPGFFVEHGQNCDYENYVFQRFTRTNINRPVT